MSFTTTVTYTNGDTKTFTRTRGRDAIRFARTTILEADPTASVTVTNDEDGKIVFTAEPQIVDIAGPDGLGGSDASDVPAPFDAAEQEQEMAAAAEPGEVPDTEAPAKASREARPNVALTAVKPFEVEAHPNGQAVAVKAEQTGDPLVLRVTRVEDGVHVGDLRWDTSARKWRPTLPGSAAPLKAVSGKRHAVYTLLTAKP